MSEIDHPGGPWMPGPAAAGPVVPEGHVQHIPFSPLDERHIARMSTYMIGAGAVAAISSLVGLVGNVVVALLVDAEGPAVIGTACGGIAGALAWGAYALLLFRAGKAFQRVAVTDDDDQGYVVEGARHLRNVFFLKAALLAMIILLVCMGFAFALLAGVAMRGAHPF